MNIGNDLKMENGLNISVDWLAFTVKDSLNWQDVITRFGFSVDQFRFGLNGANGYKLRAMHMIYPISVLYDGRDDMGVHVSVAGSAVGYFIDTYRISNTSVTPFGADAYEVYDFDGTVLSDLMHYILDMGQITRLDLAIDDFESTYFNMDTLSHIFNAGDYTSRFKSFKETKDVSKTAKIGHTIYLGSRQSALMLRIYDKSLEMQSKGKDALYDSWTRWEIELHKERATAAAAFLAAGDTLSSVSVGILSNYMRLIVRDNNRSTRCSTLPEWDFFINGVAKVRLCQPVRQKTLDEKKKWLEKAVAPTVAAIYAIDGDMSFYQSLITKGIMRLSPELLSILSQYDLMGVVGDAD